jgi:hypothetical protein
MARTYRSGYPRTQATHAPAWKRRADGGSDTKVKADHVGSTKAAERRAVRSALRQGLEPAPTRWMAWHHLPPAPRPLGDQ